MFLFLYKGSIREVLTLTAVSRRQKKVAVEKKKIIQEVQELQPVL